MGMNKSISSSMRINFKNNSADNVSFFVKPDAHMIPPHELTPDIQVLAGFSWRIEERPSKIQVIRKQPEEKNPPKPEIEEPQD
jgi:hypothetical protein